MFNNKNILEVVRWITNKNNGPVKTEILHFNFRFSILLKNSSLLSFDQAIMN